MDDWLTIVLFFLFFVLPLLEGVLKKKKGPTRDRMPPGSPRESIPELERLELERSLPGGRSTPSAADDSSWSDGWGSWPGDELQDEDVEEPVSSWSTPESAERYRAGSSASEFPPVPPETAARTPDLISRPEAGQPSEIQRLQEVAARHDRVTLAGGTTPPAPALSPIVILQPNRRRPAGKAALLLNDRGKVRQALIVSEVLGPPLANRERPQV